MRSNGWMDFVVSKVVTSQDLEDVLQREASRGESLNWAGIFFHPL